MGKTFRFIHCADLHLGVRFKGISAADPGRTKEFSESVFRSFGRIVDKALESGADAFVISGDIYDDGNELPSTRMRFVRELSRLKIPVFICRGNHDSDTSWDVHIPYPDNVHVFGPEPERIRIRDDAEIVGVSFRERNESRNLAKLITGESGLFSIGCMHCDIDSVSEGYPYAPCSVQDLRGRGIDYWALGHIHKRAVLSTEPYVVYPGNIQGHSVKETGPKGAYLVTVEDGRVTSAEFFRTCGFVWEDVRIDVAGKTLQQVISEAGTTAEKDIVMRLILEGSGELDEMLRARPDDCIRTIVSSLGCTVSDVLIRTSGPIDVKKASSGNDMNAALVRSAEEMRSMPKEELIGIICTNKIAAANRDHFMSMDEEKLRSLVDDALRACLSVTGAVR